MEQNGEDKKREKLHNKGLMNVRLKISFLSSLFVTKFYQYSKQEQETIIKLSAD